MGVMTTTSINPGGLARLRALGLSEKTWFNAIWFQSTWFLCVLGRDTWLPAALAMVALHLLLVPALYLIIEDLRQLFRPQDIIPVRRDAKLQP